MDKAALAVEEYIALLKIPRKEKQTSRKGNMLAKESISVAVIMLESAIVAPSPSQMELEAGGESSCVAAVAIMPDLRLTGTALPLETGMKFIGNLTISTLSACFADQYSPSQMPQMMYFQPKTNAAVLRGASAFVTARIDPKQITVKGEAEISMFKVKASAQLVAHLDQVQRAVFMSKDSVRVVQSTVVENEKSRKKPEIAPKPRVKRPHLLLELSARASQVRMTFETANGKHKEHIRIPRASFTVHHTAPPSGDPQTNAAINVDPIEVTLTPWLAVIVQEVFQVLEQHPALKPRPVQRPANAQPSLLSGSTIALLVHVQHVTVNLASKPATEFVTQFHVGAFDVFLSQLKQASKQLNQPVILRNLNAQIELLLIRVSFASPFRFSFFLFRFSFFVFRFSFFVF